MANRFFIVDVFGEERFAGNPLAVVEARTPIPDAEMQKIAAEFNFPETTFITGPFGPPEDFPSPRDASDGPAAFDVRIFTPRQEVPFAGHPTLGTAHVIREEILISEVESLALNLKVGRIPVRFEPMGGGSGSLLWMTQIPPAFGARRDDPGEIAALVGLSGADIDGRYPIQVVSTGIPFLLIPVKTLEAMRAARVDLDKYRQFADRKGDHPLFLFCPETYEPANRINARMFAPAFGIPEDPATGSASGCLAAYILEHGYLPGDSIRLRVEQGFEIGRRSILHLDARRHAVGLSIQVGGQVFGFAAGRLGKASVGGAGVPG